MTREELRQRSIIEYASLKQNTLLEAKQSGGSISAPGAAGGGSRPYQLRANTKYAKSATTAFADPNKSTYQLITADYDTVSIGYVVDTGVSKDLNLYGTIAVQDGASFIFGGTQDNQLWLTLTDAAGELITTINGEGGNDSLNYWNVWGFEGEVISWAYDSHNSELLTYQWYVDGVVNTTLFTNYGYGMSVSPFGGYSETKDKSHTIRIFNPNLGKDEYWILNANGVVTSITDFINFEGREYNNAYQYISSNVIMMSWHNPETDIEDHIRLIKTDGTIQDFDISEYEANYVGTYATDFGYVLVLDPVNYNYNKDLWFAFYDETLDTMEFVNAGHGDYRNDGYQVFTTFTGSPFDYNYSPEGSMNAYVVVTGNGTNTSKITTFDHVKIIAKFAGDAHYTWTNPSANFGLWWDVSNSSYSKCIIPTFFAHESGHANLQLLSLTQEGPILRDLESAFTYVTNYFEIRPMGKFTLLQWYDNGHPSNARQGFKIVNGEMGNTDVDTIWTSTNNGWDTNYDTAHVNQADENKLYYFTPVTGEWYNTTPKITNYRQSDDTMYNGNILGGTILSGDFGYEGSHNFGTTLFNFNNSTQYSVLTRETNEMGLYTPGSVNDIRVADNHLITFNLVNDVVQIKIIDTNGAVIQTVNTLADTINKVLIVKERIHIIQATEQQHQWNIFLITVDGVDVKSFVSHEGDFRSDTNDIRQLDY